MFFLILLGLARLRLSPSSPSPQRPAGRLEQSAMQVPSPSSVSSPAANSESKLSQAVFAYSGIARRADCGVGFPQPRREAREFFEEPDVCL